MKRRKEKKELVIVRYNSNLTQIITICTFVLWHMLDGHYDKQMIQWLPIQFSQNIKHSCVYSMYATDQTRPDQTVYYIHKIYDTRTHIFV